jgi:hypothetical protein
MHRTVTLAMLLALSAGTSFAAPPTEGVWADEDQLNVYAFQDNDQLAYWNKTRYHTDPKRAYLRTNGTWQAQDRMCWMGSTTGNVLLSTQGQKCCMQAKQKGDKLILTNVWGEPAKGFGLCKDQVLSRIESAPDSSVTATVTQ